MDWIDPHLWKVIYSSIVAVVMICSHFTTVLMAIDTTALKGIYQEIQNYCNVSGAHWDNVHGAGINGEAAQEVFNNYVSSSTSCSSLQQFSNSNGTGAQGNNVFTPAIAAAPVLPEDVEPEVEDVVAATATVIVLAACSSAYPVTTESVINYTAPCLPIAAPSTLASSIGTGKHTHDDALADLDTMSHMSTHLSLTGPMASTTLISEPPSAKKSQLAHHAAIVGMQGAINHIGDILDKAVNNAAPVSSSAPVPTPVPAPAPAPPPSIYNP
ncbi:hypothetical protein BDR07DRAFT_1477581 [Suillus spraguei]|nr:hypothetical protein BDR07DRAFT_1477581 [Suillus spraguei]